jgi:hypothetical protein
MNQLASLGVLAELALLRFCLDRVVDLFDQSILVVALEKR